MQPLVAYPFTAPWATAAAPSPGPPEAWWAPTRLPPAGGCPDAVGSILETCLRAVITKRGKTAPPAATNCRVNESSKALDGRVALVTGGGRGIGRAIATGLAARGVRVAILARSAEQVDQTVALITAQGGTALAVPADLALPDQVAAAFKAILERWGPIGVLVNNAAVVWPLGPSAELDPASWAQALAVNITAAARLSFAALPAMLAAGWGRIVNVSSAIAAHPAGMVRANAYATSKAGLEAHTLNLAAELAGTGVTVNAYRPGGVDTAMQAWIR